jgi:hypothetical protein
MFEMEGVHRMACIKRNHEQVGRKDRAVCFARRCVNN